MCSLASSVCQEVSRGCGVCCVQTSVHVLVGSGLKLLKEDNNLTATTFVQAMTKLHGEATTQSMLRKFYTVVTNAGGITPARQN